MAEVGGPGAGGGGTPSADGGGGCCCGGGGSANTFKVTRHCWKRRLGKEPIQEKVIGRRLCCCCSWGEEDKVLLVALAGLELAL